MYGGGSFHIVRRSGDVTVNVGVDWANIDENGLRVSTQQIVGITAPITLSVAAGATYGYLYYRVDPVSSSFASNFNPTDVNQGWTAITTPSRSANVSVKNGDWVSFAVANFNGPFVNDTVWSIKNATNNLTTIDTLNVRTYLAVGDGGYSSNSGYSSSSSSSSATSSGSGFSSSNQPPPPEDP